MPPTPPIPLMQRCQSDPPANVTPRGRADASDPFAQVLRSSQPSSEAGEMPEAAVAPVVRSFSQAQSAGPDLRPLASTQMGTSRFEVGWNRLDAALPRAIRLTLDGGGRQAVLELSPPELGSIRIELRLDGNELATRISAERSEVAERIERHRGELERSLERVGIHLDQLQIETRSTGSEGQRPGTSYQTGSGEERSQHGTPQKESGPRSARSARPDSEGWRPEEPGAGSGTHAHGRLDLRV